MGMSVSFYAGETSNFFEWRKLEQEAERLWTAAYERHADCDGKVDLPEYRWMDDSEFRTWFDVYSKSNLMLSCRLWERVPELELGNAYWFVQWILDRRTPWLGRVKDLEDIDSVLVLNGDDLDDLATRLSGVETGRDSLLRQFPIHEDLVYSSNRLSEYGASKEHMLCESGYLARFATCLGYVRDYVLGKDHQELIVEIFP